MDLTTYRIVTSVEGDFIVEWYDERGDMEYASYHSTLLEAAQLVLDRCNKACQMLKVEHAMASASL